MYASVLANSFVSEGNVAGTPITITPPWRARQAVVTNDSPTNNLSVTIGGGTLTLKPTETLTARLLISFIIVNGNGPYRAWMFG